MFSIHHHALAVCFCVITMLGWGSWANTLKLATRRGWAFEFYYWDYVVGMALSCALICLTLGSHGSSGPGALASISAASRASILAALLSGLLFNLSNVLIVIATDLAGIAVAFPVAVGLAVVIGTTVTYLQAPTGHPHPLFSGLFLLLCAMVLSGLASHLHTRPSRAAGLRGVAFAVLSGCIMGFFYPRLAASIGPAGGTSNRLTPYAAAMIFTVGLILSNLVINSILLRIHGQRYSRYFAGAAAVHIAGVAGGAIWMIALLANLVAASVAGSAVSYALGQGATLVAAFWGLFYWKEFRNCSNAVAIALFCMFLSYVGGLVLIGLAAF